MFLATLGTFPSQDQLFVLRYIKLNFSKIFFFFNPADCLTRLRCNEVYPEATGSCANLPCRDAGPLPISELPLIALVLQAEFSKKKKVPIRDPLTFSSSTQISYFTAFTACNTICKWGKVCSVRGFSPPFTDLVTGNKRN